MIKTILTAAVALTAISAAPANAQMNPADMSYMVQQIQGATAPFGGLCGLGSVNTDLSGGDNSVSEGECRRRAHSQSDMMDQFGMGDLMQLF